MVTDTWYTEAGKDWGEMEHCTGEEAVQLLTPDF